MFHWLIDIIGHLTGFVSGRPYARRSPEWSRVRAEVIAEHPYCSCCGRTTNLTVHHILPFRDHPELELAKYNLQVLCEGWTFNCHLWVGHLGDYVAGWNPSSVDDAAYWLRKIRARPQRKKVKTSGPSCE